MLHSTTWCSQAACTATAAIARNAPVTAAMPSRRAHHHVDLARAFLLHGDRERTLAELNAARAVAPQLTRYSSRTRFWQRRGTRRLLREGT